MNVFIKIIVIILVLQKRCNVNGHSQHNLKKSSEIIFSPQMNEFYNQNPLPYYVNSTSILKTKSFDNLPQKNLVYSGSEDEFQKSKNKNEKQKHDSGSGFYKNTLYKNSDDLNKEIYDETDEDENDEYKNNEDENVVDGNDDVYNVDNEEDENNENDENDENNDEGKDGDYNDSDNNNDKETTTTHRYDYKIQKINGVNLGGWLVTEPFITPSLYDNASPDGTEEKTPIDEYNFCKQLGEANAYERLKVHWDTFITETDIIKIKSYGLNAVRLPIGYWAFAKLKDDPYVFGQEEYLIKTIEWCRTHGLKLWIDLHGIPGSQNGFDNSGQRDIFDWIENSQNYELGVKVLSYIYEKYTGPSYDDVIIGYENLNEPLHNRYDISKIIKFDQQTYQNFRKHSSNHFVFHDAFLPPLFWQNQLNEPEYIDTVLDHHRYEVFDTTQLRESIDGHITSLKLVTQQYLSVSRVQVVGEWSAALTDCAKWLNGVGRRSRMDNTFQGDGFIGECRFSNDYNKLTREDRINTRRIIEAQLDIFNQTNGFFFWTWKTENAIEWSMSALAEVGLFPIPLTERLYPRVV